MGKMKLALVATSLTLMSVTIPMAQTDPVFAKCQPSQYDSRRTDNGTSYWDGALQNGTYGGVYANIYNYSPWVQPGSRTSAWTMLASGSEYYAQVGWIEYSGGTRYTFVQYTITSGEIGGDGTHAPQPTNQFTYYGTLWSPNTKVFTFQVNGSTIEQSPALSWTPGNAQLFGEIHTLASQMPGAVEDHENFYDAHVYNNGWVYWNGSKIISNNPGNWFQYQQDDQQDFDIWDSVCQGT